MMLDISVGQQTDKRKHTKPQNHCEDTHPKKSARAPNNSLGEDRSVIEENEVSHEHQEETCNQEQNQNSPENGIMLKNYHTRERSEEQQTSSGEQLVPS
jgi:hypothetical protein